MKKSAVKRFRKYFWKQSRDIASCHCYLVVSKLHYQKSPKYSFKNCYYKVLWFSQRQDTTEGAGLFQKTLFTYDKQIATEGWFAAYRKFMWPDFCSCSCDLTQKNNYISAAGVTLISLHEPGYVLKARGRSSHTYIHMHIHIQCIATRAQYTGILCAYWKLQVMTSAIMMQPWQF